ncbi:hypothetical protein VD659_08425 [Herbiconiux sp. 11R-BC]|uniref:hypothetical protein n=1 Tax=Herbiconiux sp. 11R-BC TaxID=3111637 RepID=UPI003BFBE695
MTATATTTSSTPGESAGAAPLQWNSPEAKLWVATRAGEFAGFVEFGEGHYRVTDGLGAEIGTAATLRDAKSVLTPGSAPHPAAVAVAGAAHPGQAHSDDSPTGRATGMESMRPPRREALLAAVATGFGIAALSGALLALGVLHL